MKHRIFALILAACLMLSALPVSAEETTDPTTPERAPGYCGEAIMWSYENGTLTLTGAGAMDDFPQGAPWEDQKDEIKKVVISGGITYIGAYSFCDYDKLTDVEFGSDVYEIGERAFFSCDGLTAVHLPESFKIFGPASFMGCSRLKEFHCSGRFPSFRQNCLWDTYAVIYFPAERPWSVELIQELEEAFHGRIEFLASDGTDPYVPTEPTEATEEPTQAPTEEPTTVPPTTAPDVTEAPTEEVTEPLSAETEAAPEDMPDPFRPSEAPEKPEKSGGGKLVLILIGIAGIALILLGFLLGAGRKKGKYSR